MESKGERHFVSLLAVPQPSLGPQADKGSSVLSKKLSIAD